MFTYLRFCSNIKKETLGCGLLVGLKQRRQRNRFLQYKDTSKEKEKINQINAECLIILYK